jgi:hypothetical protein
VRYSKPARCFENTVIPVSVVVIGKFLFREGSLASVTFEADYYLWLVYLWVFDKCACFNHIDFPPGVGGAHPKSKSTRLVSSAGQDEVEKVVHLSISDSDELSLR